MVVSRSVLWAKQSVAVQLLVVFAFLLRPAPAAFTVPLHEIRGRVSRVVSIHDMHVQPSRHPSSSCVCSFLPGPSQCPQKLNTPTLVKFDCDLMFRCSNLVGLTQASAPTSHCESRWTVEILPCASIQVSREAGPRPRYTQGFCGTIFARAG